MLVYVRVRLSDEDRTIQWRGIEAESLTEGVKAAERMGDVEVVLEASLTPGGVET